MSHFKGPKESMVLTLALENIFCMLNEEFTSIS